MIGLKRPKEKDEYNPFGKIANSPYPRRLRVPPLRYFNCEKVNFSDFGKL